MNGTQLTQLLATYGYGAVLLFVTIESTGIPFPGETMLLIAAVAAGMTHQLAIPWVITAAASGAILGDNLGFWIGRTAGYRFLRRYGHYIRLDERKLKLGHYLFLKHGGKVVFFGRFVAVLRAWAAFLAGTNRMSWPTFLLCNASGAVVWASLVGLSGYFLGNVMEQFSGPIGIATTVGAGLVSFIWFIVWHHQSRRLEGEAERALPGSLDDYRKVLRGEKQCHLNSQDTPSVSAPCQETAVHSSSVQSNDLSVGTNSTPGQKK
jgi:membrane protein DedA with SNARE-associated domain